jgi:hypothetical protein
MLRPIRLILETTIALILIIGIVIGGFLWRINQEPLHIDSTTSTVQHFLHRVLPSLNVAFNGAQIEAGKRGHAFQVTLTDISLLNDSAEKIGSAEKIALRFSWRNLLMLDLVPNTLEVLGPSFQLVRFDDGRVGFKGADADANQSKKKTTSLHDFFAHSPEAFEEVRIKDAWIRFNDKKGQLSLEAKKGDFILARQGERFEGAATLDVTANNFHQVIKGTISYDTAHQLTRLEFAVKDIAMSELGKLLVQIPDNMSLTSRVTALGEITVDRELQPLDFNLVLNASKGDLTYAPYFPKPIAVDRLVLRSRYNFLDDSLTLDPSQLAIGPALVTIQGHVHNLRQADQPKDIAIQGNIKNIAVDALPTYWPHEIGKNARDWVTTHMRNGIVGLATLDMEATIDTDKKFKLKKLGGKIHVNDTTVDYLPPMPPVKNVFGVASYSDKFFNIDVTSGKILDTSVTKADLRIGGFTHHTQRIDMLFDLDGPIQDTMRVVSSKPLEYLQKLNLTPEQFNGTSKTKLYLGLPLLHSLKLSDVAIKSASHLQNTEIKNIVRNITATGEKLQLKVDSNGMHLQGNATLADAPVFITWKEYFSHTSDVLTEVSLDGMLTPGLLQALEISPDPYFKGRAKAKARLVKNRDQSLALSLTADTTQAELNAPELNVTKSIGQTSQIGFDLLFEKEGPTTLSNGFITADSMTISDAMARWSKSNALESATLKQIKLGRTQASVVITPVAANHMRIVAKGSTLDLSGFWNKKPDPTTPAEANPPRYDISLRTPKLFLDETVPMTDVSADISVQGKKTLAMNIKANVEDATLNAIQTQAANGQRKLNVSASGTGKILQALNTTDTVRDGTLTLNAQSSLEEPNQLSGTIQLDKFTLVKAPVLARLINALSPVGLLDLLNNKGLGFDRLSNEIIIRDDGVVRLRKGRLAGASLGMTYAGRLYRKTDTINIKGTLIPMEGINKLASKIPVLGTILTGLNGEGILAATYRIKGPTEDPNVTVNPLSALAPGILRSIFFEDNKED